MALLISTDKIRDVVASRGIFLHHEPLTPTPTDRPQIVFYVKRAWHSPNIFTSRRKDELCMNCLMSTFNGLLLIMYKLVVIYLYPRQCRIYI